MRIAHISDIHCGSSYFRPHLMEMAIDEINRLEPEVVVCSGDLTDVGYRAEFEQAKEYLDRIECESMVVVPGNHDSRNVGYVHFEELFGDRSSVLFKDGVGFVAVDSTQPDLDDGQIGRGRYPWILEQFRSFGAREETCRLRVFILHHHLLPVPGTGRERNIVYDAGDALETLAEARVDVVLSGHKHVPYAWRLERMFVLNAGTASTLRLRGHVKPSYNVLEVGASTVSVWRKHPGATRELIVHFSLDTLDFHKHTEKIEEEVTSSHASPASPASNDRPQGLQQAAEAQTEPVEA